MTDQLTRELRVELDEVEVPELWSRVEAAAAEPASIPGVEPVGQTPRTWRYLTAAAALLIVAAAVGLLARRSDDIGTRTADSPSEHMIADSARVSAPPVLAAGPTSFQPGWLPNVGSLAPDDDVWSDDEQGFLMLHTAVWGVRTESRIDIFAVASYSTPRGQDSERSVRSFCDANESSSPDEWRIIETKVGVACAAETTALVGGPFGELFLSHDPSIDPENLEDRVHGLDVDPRGRLLLPAVDLLNNTPGDTDIETSDAYFTAVYSTGGARVAEIDSLSLAVAPDAPSAERYLRPGAYERIAIGGQPAWLSVGRNHLVWTIGDFTLELDSMSDRQEPFLTAIAESVHIEPFPYLVPGHLPDQLHGQTPNAHASFGQTSQLVWQSENGDAPWLAVSTFGGNPALNLKGEIGANPDDFEATNLGDVSVWIGRSDDDVPGWNRIVWDVAPGMLGVVEGRLDRDQLVDIALHLAIVDEAEFVEFGRPVGG